MNGDPMKKKTAPSREEQLRALAQMPEEAIDTSDIAEVLDWSGSTRGRFYRPIKQQITLRLDADVVAWFRARGPGYQTALNAVLREHIARSRSK